jgi:hypothetical protein
MTSILPFVLAGASYLDPQNPHTEMSEAIARVLDAEAPLFAADLDKHRTAALVLAVAWREGSLGLRVLGDCDQKTKAGTCIAGPRSFCSMQVHESNGGSAALNDDPDACIRKGLAMLRVSVRTCPDAPIAWYAAGGVGACSNVRSLRISRDRVWLAGRINAAASVAMLAEPAS